MARASIIALYILGASALGKLDLQRFLHHPSLAPTTTRPAASGPPSSPRGLTIQSTNGTLSDSQLWSDFALATPPWARKSNVAFSLGAGGNFAMEDWNGIAEYACQGALITEKLLALGGAEERGRVAGWLYTMPVSASGQAWEAQNTQWHVGTQGAWESSAEALLMLRLGVAHGALPPRAFTTAPQRLLCASYDGGRAFSLASTVQQPGLTDAACSAPPAALFSTFPLSNVANATTAFTIPALFLDTPSAPFSGPSRLQNNAGRALTQAFTLPGTRAATHLALPLLPRAHGSSAWGATVSVYEVATGARLASAPLPPTGASPSTWFSLPAALPAGGTYLAVLEAADAPPPGGQSKDSWFLGASWLCNAAPAQGGGASEAIFGTALHWLRRAGNASSTSLQHDNSTVVTAAGAVQLELRRVRRVDSAALPLGVSLAHKAASLNAWLLALCSQVVPSAVDVFVIPDPLFRGSLDLDVNSACSYYDLLRIGFASAYINLRVLEALEAYGELQGAGLLPSACAPGTDSTGVDNAYALINAPTPCYPAASTAAAANALRAAIGLRFSSPNGTFTDWLGCGAMLASQGNVSACGLENVRGGVVPSGSPINAVATGFLPILALAARLGVPAGGVGGAPAVQATRAAFAAARGAAQSGYYYGAGWFRNAARGLEEVGSGAANTLIASSGWGLRDRQGFAIHSEEETGDWHMYNPALVAAGGPKGFGQYTAQVENGGRFLSTTALVFEGGGGPYAGLQADYTRLVRNLLSIGVALASGNTSVPLLAEDRGFLSTPTSLDPTGAVNYLCAKVRAQFHFPNVTDAWGERLCAYYEDMPLGLPENGVVLWSAAKAYLGLKVWANGSVSVGVLSGAPPVAVQKGMPPWSATGTLPLQWPQGVLSVSLSGLAVGGAPPACITCAAQAQVLNCTLSLL